MYIAIFILVVEYTDSHREFHCSCHFLIPAEDGEVTPEQNYPGQKLYFESWILPTEHKKYKLDIILDGLLAPSRNTEKTFM